MESVEGQIIQEDSIKGESQTNGLAEVGVKILEGLIRTLKIATETRITEALASDSILLAWLAEHDAVVYNRCAVMSDGRMPWQRAYGRASTMPLQPFGEKVLFKPLKRNGEHKNSLQPRFRFAFYLGSRSRSGEHFVGTLEGVVRCRDVRRLTEDQRWDLEGLKAVKGTPWAPVNGVSTLEVPTHIVTEKVVRAEDEGEFRLDVNIKRMMIRKSDVIKYGETPGCPGCRAVLEGRRQNHTEERRKEMEKKMEADPQGAEKVEKNKRRVMEELGREVEKRVKHAEKDAEMDGSESVLKSQPSAASSSSSATVVLDSNVARKKEAGDDAQSMYNYSVVLSSSAVLTWCSGSRGGVFGRDSTYLPRCVCVFFLPVSPATLSLVAQGSSAFKS